MSLNKSLLIGSFMCLFFVACENKKVSNKSDNQPGNQLVNMPILVSDSLRYCLKLGLPEDIKSCQYKKYVLSYDEVAVYFVGFKNSKISLASHQSTSQLKELKSIWMGKFQLIIDGRPERVISSEFINKLKSTLDFKKDTDHYSLQIMPFQNLIPSSQTVSEIKKNIWVYSQQYQFKKFFYRVYLIEHNTEEFKKSLRIISQELQLYVDNSGVFWQEASTDYGKYFIKGAFNPKKLTEFKDLFERGFIKTK